MKRLTILACSCWLGLAGVALAQAPSGSAVLGAPRSPVKSVAGPAWNNDTLPPPPYTPPAAAQTAPAAGSSYEVPATRESRAHELYLMQSQMQAEAVHRAAVARAEQRTRRLESQRWFGISNTRPAASVDPVDGDYSASWASNCPFYPMRWIGGGSPWGYADGQ